MTDRGDTVAHGGEPPVDLAAVRADDALLDALGRGESAAQNNHNRTAAQNNHNPAAHNNHDPAAAQNNHDPAAHDDHDPAAPGDELAALLAGWHADLSTDLPDFPELTTVLAELADSRPPPWTCRSKACAPPPRLPTVRFRAPSATFPIFAACRGGRSEQTFPKCPRRRKDRDGRPAVIGTTAVEAAGGPGAGLRQNLPPSRPPSSSSAAWH